MHHPLKYLFIDFNSFFAAVEQQEQPALRGRPVAVAPVMVEGTCAIAASYEAKAFGIRTGTPLREARQRCPDLQVVPARHDVYVSYHDKLKTEIERHIPVHKVWSIDEMACRLDRTEINPDKARDLAQRIKQGIAARVGPCLTSSIGIAPSSLLAKIATDMQKPDGLVILQSHELPGPLFKLGLTDLPGIGEAMATRLAQSGVDTVEKLWNLAPKHARAIWGSVQGERFWYSLHGFDVPDLVTHKSVIGHSRVLDPTNRAAPEAKLVARTLLMKAAYRLRHYGLTAGGFFLAGDKWNSGMTSHVRFPQTQDSLVLLSWLNELWPGLVKAAGRPAQFRHVQVGLFDLIPAKDRQIDLFERSDVAQSLVHKREKLWHLVDQMNVKYGKEAITLASQLGQNLQYAGAKIAFNRVPDLAEFAQSNAIRSKTRRV